jgi:hypothetical protein
MNSRPPFTTIYASAGKAPNHTISRSANKRSARHLQPQEFLLLALPLAKLPVIGRPQFEAKKQRF